MFDIYSVYLVDFKKGIGGELSSKHYAIILSNLSEDRTMLVVPLTSKKKNRKYRNGFTIDCTKYQKSPTHEKAFAMINKIREVSKYRIYGDKIYDLDEQDISKLKEKLKSFLIKESSSTDIFLNELNN